MISSLGVFCSVKLSSVSGDVRSRKIESHRFVSFGIALLFLPRTWDILGLQILSFSDIGYPV